MNTKISKNIKIFSLNDENLKQLGDILHNKSSQSIWKLLVEKKHSANDIAVLLNLTLPLVMHHLKNMENVGIIVKDKKPGYYKQRMTTYYSVFPGIVILPETSADKAKNNKQLSKILKNLLVFGSIGFSAIFARILTSPSSLQSSSVENPIISNESSIIISLAILIIGIICERVIFGIKINRTC